MSSKAFLLATAAEQLSINVCLITSATWVTTASRSTLERWIILHGTIRLTLVHRASRASRRWISLGHGSLKMFEVELICPCDGLPTQVVIMEWTPSSSTG